jgi:hypothetical protein
MASRAQGQQLKLCFGQELRELAEHVAIVCVFDAVRQGKYSTA